MRRSTPFLLLCFFLTACTPAAAAVTPTPSIPARLQTATVSAPPAFTPTETPESTASSTQFPQGPWKLVAQLNLRHNIMAAGFLTENYGITVGTAPGLPFFTSDGGQTWTAGEMQADCRYGLDIIDTQFAWASGGAMNVRHTTDGGHTWPAVTDYGKGTTRPFHTISFLTDLVGWQATLYMFGSTRDGGITWTDVPLPEKLNDIASVDLIAPATGFLLDFSGALFFTRDNGLHWKRISELDLGDLAIPKAAYQMTAMRFADEQHGLIVVSEEYQAGQVRAYHTIDGGKSWTSEWVPSGSGPVFLSRQEPLLTVITGADILTVLRYAP